MSNPVTNAPSTRKRAPKLGLAPVNAQTGPGEIPVASQSVDVAKDASPADASPVAVIKALSPPLPLEGTGVREAALPADAGSNPRSVSAAFQAAAFDQMKSIFDLQIQASSACHAGTFRAMATFQTLFFAPWCLAVGAAPGSIQKR